MAQPGSLLYLHSLPLVALVGLGLLGACQPAPPSPPGSADSTAASFGPADSVAIQALQEEYRAAWLRDDTTGVLATLAPGAVIIPAGYAPIRGHEAIRDYWWPDDGSRTTIRAYRTNLEELDGAGDVAYSRGRATITFTYEQQGEASTYDNTTVSMTVYRRQPDRRWLIARRMWAQLAQ